MSSRARVIALLCIGMPVAVAACVVSGTVRASDKLNCTNPVSQHDMTRCAHLDFKAADRELNATYSQAIAAMRKMDGELPGHLKGAEEALRVAQRAWVDFRDKACASYRFIARGGTMEPMLAGMCLADLTRRRTKAINELIKEMGY